MSVRAGIAAILLLEKMEQNDAYCEKLGLGEASQFRGGKINSKSCEEDNT